MSDRSDNSLGLGALAAFIMIWYTTCSIGDIERKVDDLNERIQACEKK